MFLNIPLQSDPYATVMFIAAGLAFLVVLLVWRRRPNPTVVPFTVLMLAVSIWSFLSGMEIIIAESVGKIITTYVSYTAISVVPLGWLVFVLAYTGREHWLSRRNIALLLLHPILVTIAVWTDSLHNLFWEQIFLSRASTGTLVNIYNPNILFWVHAIYAYVLLLVGMVLLIRAFWRAPQLYRGQMTYIMVAQFIPWVANALYILDISPLPEYVDLTPLGFTITGLLVAYTVYRHRFAEIVPVAHEAIYNSISDAVFVLDNNNYIISANQSATRLLNIPQHKLIGQQAALIFANEGTLVDRYRDKQNAQEEIELHIGGEQHTFIMRLAPLTNRRGTIQGRTMSLSDITDLKRTQRELEIAREKADESVRLKSQFLANMSHELRTPLSAIIGYVGLVEMAPEGRYDADVLYTIERIETNAQYLLDMINDLLNLSRIEAGGVDLHPTSFDIREAVKRWYLQIAVLAEKKDIALNTHVDDNLPPHIMADGSYISQIAMNLIGNAIKFTPEEGSVTLHIIHDEAGQMWGMDVRDTGIGIDEDAQAYIFDEFRQVDGAHSRQYGGTGLGLAIVKHIVDAMQGRIWVESTLGEGSTFFVRFPLVVASPEPPEKQS
jgi:PAS domain S-box-containing protein